MELPRRDVIKQVGIDLSAKYFSYGGVGNSNRWRFFLYFIKWVSPPIDSNRIVYYLQIQILGIHCANLTRLLFYVLKPPNEKGFCILLCKIETMWFILLIANFSSKWFYTFIKAFEEQPRCKNWLLK